jgi:hypothetical protein
MAAWQRIAINFVLFQAGWFACVLGAAHGRDGWGVLAAGAIVARHVAWAPRPRRALALVAGTAAIGACWDSTLGLGGSLVFRSAWPAAWPALLAPAWILALWALFATTLNVSLRWLRGRGLVAAALGAVCGPLTYLGGARLGAATLVQPLQAIVLMAVGWAVLMPVLVRLARRCDGETREDAATPGSASRGAAGRESSGAPGRAAAGQAATPGPAVLPPASTRGPT